MTASPNATNKYHARRTEYGGQWYDSAGEAEYARRLDLLKAAGMIHDWRRGGEWVLLNAPPSGSRRDRITLRPDFEVWPAPDRLEVRDFKGVVTREFRLKARLWKARYPGVPLVVVWADGSETRLWPRRRVRIRRDSMPLAATRAAAGSSRCMRTRSQYAASRVLSGQGRA